MSYRFLFQGKDIVVEELVQFLISEVDTQLLKGVGLGENDRYSSEMNVGFIYIAKPRTPAYDSLC